MTRHLINGKEWEERTFNHIGYGSVSHIFAMFPNEEALVLVRQKDESYKFPLNHEELVGMVNMKEEKPDYNDRNTWEVTQVLDCEVVLRRKVPTNQKPMPEIKPGDIIQIECGDTHGVWGFDVDDELNCFHFNSHEFSLISKSTVCKIRRPNKGVIWERGSK